MASKSKRNRQRRKRKEALLAAPDVAITVAVAAPDKQKKMGGGMMSPPEREMYAEGGKLPDLTGDGKITQADVLKGRGVFQEGGEVPVDTYPNIPPEQMAAVEASQLPDTQMEEDYVDFVMNEALDQEEQTYLMNALEGDPQLSMIFDKVVDTASEFTG
ncbi:hypothetical protein, partial [Planktomarina sp.]|uniref:hypothetical protein n=1 Tax=Planktomarina sp. TaxID=2024851 RepID=UPI0032611F64